MIPKVTKETVPELIKVAREKNMPEVVEALSLRQETAKTSTSKYQKMLDVVLDDGRARGLLQFYGASRTGRWAGRLIQVQNLPQNHISDLDTARRIVATGDAELLEMSMTRCLTYYSQLIRTAFIAKTGHRFVVADFSAIEARVIAWLSGEDWRMEVFRTHGKIYEASASQMFKVPLEEVTKGSQLRQKGKVAELACIAEGQLVLTQKGLMPIESVDTSHKVWDGLEFVSHDGVIYRGKKEVITYEGLTATKDHLVWVRGEHKPIQLGIAASRREDLIQTGNGGEPVWMGKDNKPREKMEKELEGSLRACRVHWMRRSESGYCFTV